MSKVQQKNKREKSNRQKQKITNNPPKNPKPRFSQAKSLYFR